jgi:tripeptide aminopeptidase
VLEVENFNAAGATFRVEGHNVHPGYGFGKLVNAAQIVADFCARLPAQARPETTKDRQGFIHLKDLRGDVAAAEAGFIIRNFEEDGLEALKRVMCEEAERLRKENPRAKITLEFRLQYENMRRWMDPAATSAAVEAYRTCGLEPDLRPIRGGTDGARLTRQGLSCPNIFAGGMNFHSVREFVPVDAMEKGVDVVLAILCIWSQKIK